jgi:hypothetical protein
MTLQILGDLDAGRERLAVKLLIHPGTQETDQGAGLGDGEMAQRTPRRKHPARGRMAQIHQVGQPHEVSRDPLQDLAKPGTADHN